MPIAPGGSMPTVPSRTLIRNPTRIRKAPPLMCATCFTTRPPAQVFKNRKNRICPHRNLNQTHGVEVVFFDIGFILSHNQKEIFNLKPAITESEQEQRIAGILRLGLH